MSDQQKPESTGPFSPKPKPAPAPNDICTNPPPGMICTPQPEGGCFCTTPGPTVKLCTVSIVYPQLDPSAVYLAASEPHCDQAGIELAFAMILAKLLGGRF